MSNERVVHGNVGCHKVGDEGCVVMQTKQCYRGDGGGMHLQDRKKRLYYQVLADHKADNQNYLVKLEVNRSNIVSSNSRETEKSMFPGTTENYTLIMIEQTSNHSSYSWVHRKQIPCNKQAKTS